MEALLSQLPYGGWIIAIVIIALGSAAAFYMLDGYRSKKRKEEDGSEDRLINILKQTVEELEQKVDKQTKTIQELSERLDEIEKENETLREVLQGRDKETKKFQQEGFLAMKTIRETHDLITTMATSIQNTNTNMAKLIDLLSKHVDVVDHVAGRK